MSNVRFGGFGLPTPPPSILYQILCAIQGLTRCLCTSSPTYSWAKALCYQIPGHEDVIPFTRLYTLNITTAAVTTVDYAIDGTTLTLPDNAVITVCE
jgi:hypothetical protein